MEPRRDHHVIDRFLTDYRRQYDFWLTLAEFVATNIRDELRQQGIPALVTSRAKSPERLAAKVKKLSTEEAEVSRTYLERRIVDRAAARIALYSVDDMDAVDRALRRRFLLIHKDAMDKKHGYRATHYRGYLSPTLTAHAGDRFADTIFEIQVATVMMHAWSEVEHDTIYKQLDGTTSDKERELIRQLNQIARQGDELTAALALAREERLRGPDGRFLMATEMEAFIRQQMESPPPEWLTSFIADIFHQMPPKFRSPASVATAIESIADPTTLDEDSLARALYQNSASVHGYLGLKYAYLPAPVWHKDADGQWRSGLQYYEDLRNRYIEHVDRYPDCKDQRIEEELDAWHTRYLSSSGAATIYPRENATTIGFLVDRVLNNCPHHESPTNEGS